MAKITSLVVKVGALVIIIALPTKYAIELQLLGGVWILQTLPAIVVGLYTRWLHRWALVAGWAVGMVVGYAHGRLAGLRARLSTGDLRDDDQRLHGCVRAGREPRRLVARTLVLHRIGPADAATRRDLRTSTSSTRTTSTPSAKPPRR